METITPPTSTKGRSATSKRRSAAKERATATKTTPSDMTNTPPSTKERPLRAEATPCHNSTTPPTNSSMPLFAPEMPIFRSKIPLSAPETPTRKTKKRAPSFDDAGLFLPIPVSERPLAPCPKRRRILVTPDADDLPPNPLGEYEGSYIDKYWADLAANAEFGMEDVMVPHHGIGEEFKDFIFQKLELEYMLRCEREGKVKMEEKDALPGVVLLSIEGAEE
ncbi:hypothetical protein OQA88_8930 [Cercophora sp. LCS_1]